jgi:predicted  nucleic acid-binding Zn-ribbon protein
VWALAPPFFGYTTIRTKTFIRLGPKFAVLTQGLIKHMSKASLFLTVSAGRLQWCTENLLNAKPFRNEIAQTARNLFPKNADCGVAFWRPDVSQHSHNANGDIVCAFLNNRPDPQSPARNALHQYILILSAQDYHANRFNPFTLLRTILTPDILDSAFPHNAPPDKVWQPYEDNERITVIDNTYGEYQPSAAPGQTPQLDVIQSFGVNLGNVQAYLAAGIAQPTKLLPLCFSIEKSSNAVEDFWQLANLLETLYLCLPSRLWTNISFCWAVCQDGPDFNTVLSQAVEQIHSNPPNELAAVMADYVKPLFSSLAEGNFQQVERLRDGYDKFPLNPLFQRGELHTETKGETDTKANGEISSFRKRGQGDIFSPQPGATIIYGEDTDEGNRNVEQSAFFGQRDFIWMGLSALLIVVAALLAFYAGTFFGTNGKPEELKPEDILSQVKSGFISTFALPNKEDIVNENDPKALGQKLGDAAKSQAEQSVPVSIKPSNENKQLEEFKAAFFGAYKTEKYDYTRALSAITIAQLGDNFGKLSDKKELKINELYGEMADNKARLSQLDKALGEKAAEIDSLNGDIKEEQQKVAQLEKALGDKTAEINSLNGEIQQKQQNVAQLEKALGKKTAEINSLTGEIHEEQQNVVQLEKALGDKTAEIDTLTGDIKEKQQQVAQLETDLDNLNQAVKAMLVQYQTGYRDGQNNCYIHQETNWGCGNYIQSCRKVCK